MDKEILKLLKSDKEPDSARFLLLELVAMLRTGKAGLLQNQELRFLLADRLDKALTVKADEVSDALCITDGKDGSKYGKAKYDFMLWYFGFMDQGKKPSAQERDNWCHEHPDIDGDNIAKSTVDKWIKSAKDNYKFALQGAATLTVTRGISPEK